MLQDIEAGRRTEIDEINGELVRIGEANDVRMDVNRSLWTLLRAAEGRQMPSERIEST
jgi:ketopantoate reductase